MTDLLRPGMSRSHLLPILLSSIPGRSRHRPFPESGRFFEQGPASLFRWKVELQRLRQIFFSLYFLPISWNNCHQRALLEKRMGRRKPNLTIEMASCVCNRIISLIPATWLPQISIVQAAGVSKNRHLLHILSSV